MIGASINVEIVVYALLGGILPALVWLSFWLREDSRKPEPRGLILRTFVFGMIAVVLVLPFQEWTSRILPNFTVFAFLIYATLEEVFKLGAAYFGGLDTPEDDEPVDPLVYMITGALGFVALENTLFILDAILDQNLVAGVIMSNMRFVGASVLHIIASGIVGAGMTFSFYSSGKKKSVYVVTSLIIAILFHTAFNVLLNSQTELGGLIALVSVWISVLLLLLTFEKAKTLRRRRKDI